jgi:peroxiredoxin
MAAPSWIVGIALCSIPPAAGQPVLVAESHEVSVDEDAGLAHFALVYNREPDFMTMDGQGRQADSFQFHIDTNPEDRGGDSPYPWETIIRGEEIHIGGDIPVRDHSGGPSITPESGGWGPAVGSIPHTVAGTRHSFTVPFRMLNTRTGRFTYRLELYRYGQLTGHWDSQGPPAQAAARPDRGVDPAQPQERDPAAEARVVLDRARAAYQAAQTYRDTAVIRHEMAPRTDDEGAQSHETNVEFLFARPASIVLRNEFGGVYCDGTKLWMHNARTGEYTESAAPPSIDLRDLDRQLPSAHLASHPLALALAGDALSSPPWPDVQVLTGVTRALLDGDPGQCVVAMGRGDIPMDEGVPMALWFSDRTGLLGGTAIGAQAEDRGSPPPRRARVTMTTRLHDVRVGEPIEGDAFVFKPRPSDRLVDALQDPLEQDRSEQQAMVGGPAPDIAGTTLDGATFRLAELKGRVVMLVFWDTWCSSSVDAAAAGQELSERHGQSLAVVGVNQDQPEAAERVHKLLRDKRISPCQIKDEENAVARAYAVPGVPCTVLIDRDGEVRRIRIGFAPEDETALAEDVQALLAGRDLREPTRISRGTGD